MIGFDNSKKQKVYLSLTLVCFIGYILMAGTEWYRLKTETCLFHYVAPEHNYLLLLLSSILLYTNNVVAFYFALYCSVQATSRIFFLMLPIILQGEKVDFYGLIKFFISLENSSWLNLVQILLYFIELFLAPSILLFTMFNILYRLYVWKSYVHKLEGCS